MRRVEWTSRGQLARDEVDYPEAFVLFPFFNLSVSLENFNNEKNLILVIVSASTKYDEVNLRR